jgi:ketosteroid isomerase-like protein
MKGEQAMRYLILVFSISLILISCETRQEAPTQENVEQAILAKERQSLDRWSAGDPLGYAEGFAEDVSYFDDIGAQTRIDGLEELQSYLTSLVGQVPPHSYEIVNHRVQVYGDVAISTLRYHATIEGEPGPPWKATNVYNWVDSDWQLVHANWSLVERQ